MKLLIFAHRGEAQSFIKALGAKAVSEILYQYTEGFIYICSEGIYDVLTNLPLILKNTDSTEVINYGIAGSLSKQLEGQKIFSISGVYLEDNNEIQFKSFTLSGETECITAHKRVLTPEYAKKLQPFAKIVDRELWAIAKVCHNFKINLKAYKLISDLAGDNTDCFDLKNRAQQFSEIMLEHYQASIQDTNIVDKEEVILPFQTSQYQMNVIKKLISETDTELINKIINEYKKKGYTSKSDANHFIKEVKSNLYPLKNKIHNQIKETLNSLDRNNIKYNYDKNLEKEKLNISIEINSQKNIDDAIKSLKDLKYEKFLDIFKGNINV